MTCGWMARTATVVIAGALIVARLTVNAAAGPEPTELTVDIKPTAMTSKEDLRAVVHVVPAAANRLLVIALDAEGFYSSTQRELAGASAPRLYEFYFRELPPGDYVLHVRVEDASGGIHSAERRFTVFSSTRALRAALPKHRR
jgi:hypothetical protein